MKRNSTRASRDDFEGLQGTFNRPNRYRSYENEDFGVEGGLGDSSISYGMIEDGRPRPDDEHVWFEPEYSTGSDYSGSGLVAKANYESLLEEANRLSEDELGGDTSWFQTFHGDHGTYAIMFHVDKTPPEIIEMLAGLSDYPLISDDKHSELQVEAQNEAWERWAESDYRRALEKKFDGDADDIDDEVLFEHFREALDESNTDWVNEQGDEMYIDIERIVDAAEEPPDGFKFESDQNGMSKNAKDLPGCKECQEWARLKAERGLPTAGDTYCAKCGAREADVSRAVKARMRRKTKPAIRSNAGKYYEIEYYRTDDGDFTHTEHWYVRAASAGAAKGLFREAVKGGDESIWEESFGSRPEDSGDDTYYVMLDPEEEGWEAPVLMIRIGDAKKVPKSEVDEDKLLNA